MSDVLFGLYWLEARSSRSTCLDIMKFFDFVLIFKIDFCFIKNGLLIFIDLLFLTRFLFFLLGFYSNILCCKIFLIETYCVFWFFQMNVISTRNKNKTGWILNFFDFTLFHHTARVVPVFRACWILIACLIVSEDRSDDIYRLRSLNFRFILTLSMVYHVEFLWLSSSTQSIRVNICFKEFRVFLDGLITLFILSVFNYCSK